MEDSVILDPDNGLNPTIPQCYFCGKDKNEIILLGIRGKEHPGYSKEGGVPMHCGVIDTEPCDTCKGYMKQGVIILSVKDGTNPEDPYRTGGFWVIKDDAIRRILSPEVADQALKARCLFLEDSACEKLGLWEFPPQE